MRFQYFFAVFQRKISACCREQLPQISVVAIDQCLVEFTIDFFRKNQCVLSIKGVHTHAAQTICLTHAGSQVLAGGAVFIA